MHAKYAFALRTTSLNNGDAAMQSDYPKALAMEASFAADRTLVHDLVYGSGTTMEGMLRTKMWVTRFGDQTLVDVYAHGIKDPAEKKQREPLQNCLSVLANATQMGVEIHRLEEEKAQKPWRKNITGVPEAQLAALDAENVATRDADIMKRKQQRQDYFDSPSCKVP
jgi:hypothetical protein